VIMYAIVVLRVVHPAIVILGHFPLQNVISWTLDGLAAFRLLSCNQLRARTRTSTCLTGKQTFGQPSTSSRKTRTFVS